jgi:hypothetical protein
VHADDAKHPDLNWQLHLLHPTRFLRQTSLKGRLFHHRRWGRGVNQWRRQNLLCNPQDLPNCTKGMDPWSAIPRWLLSSLWGIEKPSWAGSKQVCQHCWRQDFARLSWKSRWGVQDVDLSLCSTCCAHYCSSCEKHPHSKLLLWHEQSLLLLHNWNRRPKLARRRKNGHDGWWWGTNGSSKPWATKNKQPRLLSLNRKDKAFTSILIIII